MGSIFKNFFESKEEFGFIDGTIKKHIEKSLDLED